MLLIVIEDGRTLTGLLKEETGTALTLLQADGRQVVIPRGSIEERVSQKISPMPSFERLLTPRQVADLTAFLLSLKSRSN